LALYENRTLASAITAAVTGMLVGYPFDSLKTRMQTHQYQSLLACARRSISEEGVAGLYRGLLPPLLTASTAKSMSFSVFEQTKQWLRQHDPYRDKAPPFGITDFQRKTTGSIALTAGLAGSISGAVIAAICCPLELVKVQMQLARLMNRPSSLQSISAKLNTTQNKTPTEKVMHCGHLRDSSGTAIYFAAYETVKETLRRITGSETTGPMTHMLAGGTCGVVSWLLIFPVDLVKSTIQSQVL
ncbi:mitochondrial carrier domain-containing protein, partial [Coemansia spiralis]